MPPQSVEPILNALRGAYVAADEDGKILCANMAASALLGWSPMDLMGQPIAVIVPERLREAHRAGLQRFLETGQSRLMGRPVRVPALGSDGIERTIDLTVLAYQEPSGRRTLFAVLHPLDAPLPDVVALEDLLAGADYRPVIAASQG